MQLQQRRASGGLSGRCPDCGKKREDAVSYTIEDLDAVDGVPLESNFPGQVCTCDENATAVRTPEPSPSYRRPHPDLHKYRSVEMSRWSGNYLAPDDATVCHLYTTDDAIWGLQHAGEDTEYRWEMHTSRTDIDLNRKTKCSCHDLTPEEKRHPGRGDLKKHHSAETDKWSLRADALGSEHHDLRKHLSDASGMARELGQQPMGKTLQVPEVMPNPKPRCTCPKPKFLTPSPPADKRSQRFADQENKVMFSKSLTPEESLPVPEKKPELKKTASEDVRVPLPRRERGRLVQQRAIEKSSIKKWEPKEKVVSPVEERKAQRSKWAGMTHFSLQPEKKEIKYGDPKSKSLKERQRYSVRRSLSPEPDPRGIVRVDSRIVKRLISPDITITSDAKWAPYEGYSPLPNVGIRKREPKHIREIKWTPYDGSASELSILEVPEEAIAADDYHITPTCHPPPRAPSMKEEDDEDERARWRFLNQVSPFPIYQGAWKEISPERTPPKTPEDLEPPIWTPMEPPATPVKRRKPSLIVEPIPVPVKLGKESRKEKKRLKKAESAVARETTLRLAPPTVIIRASSEDQQKARQRPLLTRSKALLEVPRKGIDITKRSHSEEVPRHRGHETHHGPSRARSEESSMYPWNDDGEVRQYVTTV
uniref:Klf3 protein n=1 Tax=Fopius arisanus TaxID=64838 RepID=A0A0C9PIQ9_9HYME